MWKRAYSPAPTMPILTARFGPGRSERAQRGTRAARRASRTAAFFSALVGGGGRSPSLRLTFVFTRPGTIRFTPLMRSASSLAESSGPSGKRDRLAAPAA